MSTFHPKSPIGFAHRGGRAHFRENTLKAFRNALNEGIRGIETDAWLSKDRQVVLDHDGLVRSFWRPWGQQIATFDRSSLPQHMPTFNDLCELLGPDVDVQLDVKDDECAAEIVNVYRGYYPNSLSHLWLAHDGYKKSNWTLVTSWRALAPEVRLVDSTRLRRMDLPVAQYAERAKAAGMSAINLKANEWSPELVDQIHGAGLLCFGFNAQSETMIRKLKEMKIDAIYSDHIDRLKKVLAE